MYGAILGDIIGSPFEFDRGDKTKDFELFTPGCEFTDDSVMTIAVAEALIAVGPDAEKEEIEEAVVSNMQDWGRRFPDAGYGGRFCWWLREKNPKPYGSFGNGSAMRVSAVGWLYPTLERTRQVAVYTAEVTHNHKEGIKGAEATASCIFLARQGATKDEIKSYVEDNFGYNLNRTLDEIRPGYHMDESCQGTVPEAIIAFLESENFEDAIRNAVSLGGDADTLAAITGSIAEAFYEIPELLREECKARVTKDMLGILELFDEIIDRERMDSYDNEIAGNEGIETSIHQLYALEDKNSFLFFVTMMCARMRVGGQVLVSFVTFGDDMYCDLDVYNLKKGDTVTLNHDVRMHMDTVTSETEDGEWFFFFTNHEELKRQESGNVVMSVPLKDMLEISYHSNKVNGLVVNPFGRYVKLDKKLLKIILDEFNKNWKVEEK